ncbi:MAG: hypothetical protein KAQ96_09875, partial [Thermoplasmata archaeon]|nr:hypothetical protein [Thermoplasmata archaeon]
AAGSMTVHLAVRLDNLPPVIEPIPDVEVIEGQPLLIEVNASDPDGGPVTISTSLPGSTIDGMTIRWTPGDDDAGVHYPVVTATDDSDASTEVRFRLLVRVTNSVPIVQGHEGEVSVEEGGTVHVPVSAVDADGDTLSYHLASPDKGFTIDQTTGLVTFQAEGLEPGVYKTTVVVTDGKAAAEREIKVTVEGPSSVPVLWLLLGGLLLIAVVIVMFTYRR